MTWLYKVFQGKHKIQHWAHFCEDNREALLYDRTMPGVLSDF